MASVLYNTKFGGYSLSPAACALYRDRTGSTLSDYEMTYKVERTDPVLIQVVHDLGSAADGPHARLAIAEIPDGSRYRIDEYDGKERVMTPDDYDWSVA